MAGVLQNVRDDKNINKFLIYVSLGIIVFCLVVSVLLFYLSNSNTEGYLINTKASFFFSIGLLFFAISSIGIILFAGTVSKMELTTFVASLSIGGPAVLWFILLFITSHYLVEDDWFEKEPMTLEKLGLAVEDFKLGLGWSSYRRLENDKPNFRVFWDEREKISEEFEESLQKLSARTIDDKSAPLRDVSISTLYVYSKNRGSSSCEKQGVKRDNEDRNEGENREKRGDQKESSESRTCYDYDVIKLQRIDGVKAEGKEVRVPFRSRGSTKGEVVSADVDRSKKGSNHEFAAYLVLSKKGGHNEVTRVGTKSDGDGYIYIKDPEVDVFTFTRYEDYSAYDYIFVDYREFIAGNNVDTFRLGLSSDFSRIVDSELWMAKPDLFKPKASVVPVSFTKLRTESNKGGYSEWFGDWPKMIEMLANGQGQNNLKDNEHRIVDGICYFIERNTSDKTCRLQDLLTERERPNRKICPIRGDDDDGICNSLSYDIQDPRNVITLFVHFSEVDRLD